MQSTTPRFKKYLFVCENLREKGVCCAAQGSGDLRERLKEEVKQRGLQSAIRVSRTGCLDVCAEGPNVLLVPDYIWFKHVGKNDIEEIIKKAAGDL